MRQNPISDTPFTLNSHVSERVKAWENLKLSFEQTASKLKPFLQLDIEQRCL